MLYSPALQTPITWFTFGHAVQIYTHALAYITCGFPSAVLRAVVCHVTAVLLNLAWRVRYVKCFLKHRAAAGAAQAKKRL